MLFYFCTGNGTLEDESITNSLSEVNNEEEIFNDCNNSNELDNGSTTIEIHNESNFEISSIKKVIDFKNKSTETSSQIDQVATEQNKNVEAERFPINQIELTSFCAAKNNTRQQALSYKKPSIIKIQSSTNIESTVSTMEDVTNLKSSDRNESSSSSTTTIRLLNTNHSKLNMNNDNNPIGAIRNKNSNYSMTKMGNKLTTHPYLCRLRATNDKAFEQNSYSKKTIPVSVSKQIPDIQRV